MVEKLKIFKNLVGQQSASQIISKTIHATGPNDQAVVKSLKCSVTDRIIILRSGWR